MKFLQIRQHVLSIMNDSSISADSKVINILDFMCEHNKEWSNTWVDSGYCYKLRCTGPLGNSSHDLVNWVSLYAKSALQDYICSTESGNYINNSRSDEAIERYGQKVYYRVINLIENPLG